MSYFEPVVGISMIMALFWFLGKNLGGESNSGEDNFDLPGIDGGIDL